MYYIKFKFDVGKCLEYHVPMRFLKILSSDETRYYLYKDLPYHKLCRSKETNSVTEAHNFLRDALLSLKVNCWPKLSLSTPYTYFKIIDTFFLISCIISLL